MVGINSQRTGIIGSYNAAFARQASYWSKTKANRESLGNAMSSTRSMLASVTNSLAQAQADQISGTSNIAAQTGLDRINKARKTQSAAMLKQIDSVQASVDKAKTEAALKQKYYVYMLPAVTLVDVSTIDTEV